MIKSKSVVRMKIIVLLPIYLTVYFASSSLFAQDSVNVLNLKDFFTQIIAHHPIARQAELMSETAKQELRVTRGLFDPTISSKYYSKSFKGDNYFDLWDNTLRIPTWFGTDFVVGYERNSGKNINPEDYTPNAGLTSFGISVPLGEGLIMDERRMTLRHGQLFKDLAEAEQIKMINKLLLQASKDYWDWALAHGRLQLNSQALQLARVRLTAVKERILNGDLAVIDSIEAKIQVQNLEVAVQDAQVAFRNYTLLLSNYLWKENLTPVEIHNDIIPSWSGSEVQTINKDSVERLVMLASTSHPEIVKINLKLQQLEVEKKFYKDKLKPKLNLDYSILQTGFSAGGEMFTSDYLLNNFKVGIGFSQSLFMRNERGKLQLNKLKIQDSQYSLQQETREIKNTVSSSYNEWLALEGQIQTLDQTVKNYEILLRGEMQRFDDGESSLFLVNQREVNLISSRLKLLELKSKYAKNKIFLQWAAGRIEL